MDQNKHSLTMKCYNFFPTYPLSHIHHRLTKWSNPSRVTDQAIYHHKTRMYKYEYSDEKKTKTMQPTFVAKSNSQHDLQNVGAHKNCPMTLLLLSSTEFFVPLKQFHMEPCLVRVLHECQEDNCSAYADVAGVRFDVVQAMKFWNVAPGSFMLIGLQICIVSLYVVRLLQFSFCINCLFVEQ